MVLLVLLVVTAGIVFDVIDVSLLGTFMIFTRLVVFEVD